MINLARALDDERLIEKIDELEEENKKLKEEKEFFYKSAKQFREENEKLKEKVETLELWLDNKEKLNEEYRKQIDKLRTDNIYEEWLYD